MDTIEAISYLFNLEKVVKENIPEVTRKTLLDVCRKRWLERIDVVYLFVDLFLAILMTLEEFFFLTWKISITRALLLEQNLL